MSIKRNVHPSILIIGGPTASGKSELALDLAEYFGGLINNADSMQVYRELQFLSARPSPEDEMRIPHRLYGILSVREQFSVALWRDMALQEIGFAQENNLLPIIVGGTGLYLRSLVYGLAFIPPIPSNIREKAILLRKEMGATKFYESMYSRDPVGMSKIHPKDSQRVIRAYEVLEATGESLLNWQRLHKQSDAVFKEAGILILQPSRKELYEACDKRARRIAAEGGIEEVQNLLNLGLNSSSPAMKALGVKEFSDFINGTLDFEPAVTRLCKSTRNYAKRQSTWFRNQMPDANTVDKRYDKLQRCIIIELVKTLLGR